VTVTMSPSSAPTSTPAVKKCKVEVKELDDSDSNNQGVEQWTLNVWNSRGDAAIDGSPFCLHEAKADERNGIKVDCPHLGEAPRNEGSVRREDGDGLRFIWVEKSWSSDDDLCQETKHWHPDDRLPVSDTC
jgi:hypothetical protein